MDRLQAMQIFVRVAELKSLGYFINVITNFGEALANHSILFDACPAGEIISAQYIGEKTFVAAPGIPLGIAADGLKKISDRLLHDPLQLGVAAMLFDVL